MITLALLGTFMLAPVVAGDAQAMGCQTKVLPLVQVVAVLVEDLNPVVPAVGHVEPAPRIHGKVMRLVELPGVGASAAPRGDEFARW